MKKRDSKTTSKKKYQEQAGEERGYSRRTALSQGLGLCPHRSAAYRDASRVINRSQPPRPPRA